MSHTPGPWIARQQFHAYRKAQSLGWIIETSNQSRIAWSSYADAETNEGEGAPHEIGGANARLIAAAPALLEAAEAALLTTEECLAAYHASDNEPDECPDAIAALRAAIKQARGTQ